MQNTSIHRAFIVQPLLAILLFAGPVFARDGAPVWPMPAPLPTAPEGINTATYPMPRVEWLVRVKTTNEKAKAQASSIELIFDGDSITDGWQSRGKEVWEKRYGKLHAFDFGIAADRTEHLLWRLSQGQVDGLHPKLVAILIGTNNLLSNTPEQTAEGVKAIVAEYRQRCPDAVVLLQAVFPRGNLATDPMRAKIKEVNRIIAKLDDGKKVIFIDFGDKFLSPDGTLGPDIMPDFLHPNAKGYEIWADAIQPVIDKYLSK